MYNLSQYKIQIYKYIIYTSQYYDSMVRVRRNKTSILRSRSHNFPRVVHAACARVCDYIYVYMRG